MVNQKLTIVNIFIKVSLNLQRVKLKEMNERSFQW